MLKSVKWLIPANLALFDEGAAGASAGATEGTATTGTSQAASGEKPVVVYGKEGPDTAENQTTPDSKETAKTKSDKERPTGNYNQYAGLSPEDKEKAYNELIKGDFKDLFEKHTQKIINERFRATKQMEARLNETQQIVDLLMPRYGAKSVTDLAKALQEEVLPELAEEAGMTPEAYKRQIEMEQELSRLKAAQEEQKMNERVAGWFTQAEALKQDFPEFNLQKVSENEKYGPNFLRLLESGIDVKSAYLAAFHDELVDRARVETAKKAESATLEAIKAGGMRPPEIGAKRQSGIVRKSSVYELSAEDRAEIARKAARGEKIRF